MSCFGCWLSKFQLTEEDIHYLMYVEVLPYVQLVSVRSGRALIASDPSDDMFLRVLRRRAPHTSSAETTMLLQIKFYNRFQSSHRPSFYPIRLRRAVFKVFSFIR